ncbi:TPA: hypothetical protein ACH3X1_000164 [Trebouxia sp. C0004]
MKWLADECADKKHDGHNHEHMGAIAGWSRGYMKHPLQSKFGDCGVLAIMFMSQLGAAANLSFVQQQHMQEYRQHLASCLLQHKPPSVITSKLCANNPSAIHAAGSPSSNKRKASPPVSKAKRNRPTARKLTPFCTKTATPDSKAVCMSDSLSPSVCNLSQADAAAASVKIPCGRSATSVAAGATADRSDAVKAPAKCDSAMAIAITDFAVAIATAESGAAAEGTESPAATARTGTATAAGNISFRVAANAASPATAAPADVVAEQASDPHTHAASATAAEPADVTLIKCAKLIVIERRASHRAVIASPEAADDTAAGSPSEATLGPLLPLATSPPASNVPLARTVMPSPSAAGLSDNDQGSENNST